MSKLRRSLAPCSLLRGRRFLTNTRVQGINHNGDGADVVDEEADGGAGAGGGGGNDAEASEGEAASSFSVGVASFRDPSAPS